MLNFSGRDQESKPIALHYAKILGEERIYTLISENLPVESEKDAVRLAKFYWSMLDQSILDEKNGLSILGNNNVRFSMERLLHIIGGYLSSSGYEDIWDKVVDEA